MESVPDLSKCSFPEWFPLIGGFLGSLYKRDRYAGAVFGVISVGILGLISERKLSFVRQIQMENKLFSR